MPHIREPRPLGAAGAQGNVISQPAIDGSELTRPASDSQVRPAARLRRQATQIHSLGPVALGYFLADLARGEPLQATLEDYAALEPFAELVRAYAVTPRPFLIGGGRP